MLDIRILRERPDVIRAAVRDKGYDIDVDYLLKLDERRRQIQARLDKLRSERRKISKEIGITKAQGKDVSEISKKAKSISSELDRMQEEEKRVNDEFYQLFIRIPNIPLDDVPKGDASCNKVVKESFSSLEKGFEVKPHWEVAERLGIMDLSRASKISGTHFPLFMGMGAKLQRALINFMIELHTSRGYKEVWPPYLVNRKAMFGTGQLPNLEEDMYHLQEDDLFLIPTAEVPVTNLHQDEVLEEEVLPLYYVAYTPCFRREAGSYGKDTKGLLRVHQFDKVELVKICRPEDSIDEHQDLLNEAEEVLRQLGLPYRVVLLASGDLSFAAAKCYDLEVWSPGVGKWLEVSSCSNFLDFQARRANIRFKRKEGGKREFVHTLNSSGLALARVVAAILEWYQLPDGRIEVPKALKGFMGLDFLE